MGHEFKHFYGSDVLSSKYTCQFPLSMIMCTRMVVSLQTDSLFLS